MSSKGECAPESETWGHIPPDQLLFHFILPVL